MRAEQKRSWQQALDALEEELNLLEQSLDETGFPAETSDRPSIDLNELGPLPIELADRARAVAERTARFEARLVEAVAEVAGSMSKANQRFRVRPESPQPKFIDHSA